MWKERYTPRGKMMWRDTGRRQPSAGQGEAPGTNPSLTDLGRNQPYRRLDLGLLTSRTERQKNCCLSRCVAFCMAALANYYNEKLVSWLHIESCCCYWHTRLLVSGVTSISFGSFRYQSHILAQRIFRIFADILQLIGFLDLALLTTFVVNLL